MSRRRYVADVEIDAPRDVVWQVLTDLDEYPRWNPFTVEVRGSLQPGAPVRMKVRMAKLGITVRQTETLFSIVPKERIVWGTSMLGGLVRAARVQSVESIGAGRTRYRTEDTIEGGLGWIVFTLFGPSIEHGFRAMAEALAEQAAARRRSQSRPRRDTEGRQRMSRP